MRTDPRFDLEMSHENALGIRTAGWVMVGFAGLLWIFLFISVRDGTDLFPAWATVQTLAGLALIGIGFVKENEAAEIEARMAPPEIRTHGV